MRDDQVERAMVFFLICAGVCLLALTAGCVAALFDAGPFVTHMELVTNGR